MIPTTNVQKGYKNNLNMITAMMDNNGWNKGLSGDPDEDQYYYQ